jgi:hypothetical protein
MCPNVGDADRHPDVLITVTVGRPGGAADIAVVGPAYVA